MQTKSGTIDPVSVGRSFQAKVLGTVFGRNETQLIRFADIDDEFTINPSDDLREKDEIPKHDLTDVFQCLDFVTKQVQRRHSMSALVDYQVTMTVLSEDRDGSLEKDELVIRPWHKRISPIQFANLRKKQ